MGLRMDDIHTPTVPSGPSSSLSRPVDPSNDKRSLMELMELKTKLEEELSTLGSVLDSHNVTMTTTLTTFDGFPRSDIDVAQIRTTRSRIIHLKNDHKTLMQAIERGLHAQHAEYQASAPPPSSNSSSLPPSSQSQPQTASALNRRGEEVPDMIETPFARINSVADGSPAAEAGLRVGDKVRRVGEANWLNHEKLSKVAEVVQRNQGTRVMFRVSRPREGATGGAEELELGLIPRSGWGGRGLLGCHILPL